MVTTPQFENSTAASGNAMNSCRVQNRRRSLEVRQRRMNLLLICVVAFFALCWLPLNVLNALLSFEVVDYNVVAFSSCHVFGMMSACANPILYGVFNENFRQEFIAILTCLRIVPVVRFVRKLTMTRRTANANGQNEIMDNGVVGAQQQATIPRTSFKKKSSQGSRKNSHRAGRVASEDGFQKLLDTSPGLTVTANGSCYNNVSSATGTNCSPPPYESFATSPPTVHLDEFEMGLGASGGSGESVAGDPTVTSPTKKKLDNLTVGNSSPEEHTPLFSDSGCAASEPDTGDDRTRTYVIVTDL